MLAARGRAGGAGARAALLRGPATGTREVAAPATTTPEPAAAPPGATASADPAPQITPEVGPPDRDTIFRLREAKRRASRR
jgi:hypothetical protein